MSHRDIEGVDHAAEVTADSLYEAVAAAVAPFRREDGWAMCAPGPGCESQLRVMPRFARHASDCLEEGGDVRPARKRDGSKDILRKERMRRSLGLESGP